MKKSIICSMILLLLQSQSVFLQETPQRTVADQFQDFFAFKSMRDMQSHYSYKLGELANKYKNDHGFRAVAQVASIAGAAVAVSRWRFAVGGFIAAGGALLDTYSKLLATRAENVNLTNQLQNEQNKAARLDALLNGSKEQSEEEQETSGE